MATRPFVRNHYQDPGRSRIKSLTRGDRRHPLFTSLGIGLVGIQGYQDHNDAADSLRKFAEGRSNLRAKNYDAVLRMVNERGVVDIQTDDPPPTNGVVTSSFRLSEFLVDIAGVLEKHGL